MTTAIETVTIDSRTASLVLASTSGLAAGQQVIIQNTLQGVDGLRTLTSLDAGTDTVTFSVTLPDLEETEVINSFLFTDVEWVDSDDVIEFLGISAATANDTAFIGTCVDASNWFCFRRRSEAGYCDCPTTVPDGSVHLAATLYAAIQYRTRGSVDGYSSFDTMGTVTPIGSYGQVLQLLGCGKPQIG